ncbi:hypothetical protein ACLOJK_008924 [Asimina triloba]
MKLSYMILGVDLSEAVGALRSDTELMQVIELYRGKGWMHVREVPIYVTCKSLGTTHTKIKRAVKKTLIRRCHEVGEVSGVNASIEESTEPMQVDFQQLLYGGTNAQKGKTPTAKGSISPGMQTRSMRAKNVGQRHHAHLDAGGKQQGLQKGKEKLVEPPPEEDESVGPYYFGEDDSSFESIDLDDEGFEPVRKSEKPISFKDSNLSNPQLAVGMQFKSIRLLRTALVEFTIRGHFDIYYIRNESRSVIARCKVEGRQWKRTASKEGSSMRAVHGRSQVQIHSMERGTARFPSGQVPAPSRHDPAPRKPFSSCVALHVQFIAPEY